MRGELPLANVQQKEKQKAWLGKRVTVGNSCCSSGRHKTTGYWWTMLCCLGKERESHSKADKRCSKSRQWKLGTGIATQTLEKLKSCIVRGCVFLPCCSPLYQQRCACLRIAVVWKAVTLASPAHMCLCASEKPSTRVCSNQNDFCSALGKHRLEKVTERTIPNALVETVLLFLFIMTDFSPPFCLLL